MLCPSTLAWPTIVVGGVLVNRLRQACFARAEFDSGRFNLHVDPDASPRTLVVLVHGLGGSGYQTWGQLPERLFAGTDGPAVDIGVYDYRSGLRRLLPKMSDFEFWTRQLGGHLRDLETEYSDIFLVGHSMGGVLIETVARNHLEARAFRHEEGAGALAALVAVASPLAGSGWALPLLGLLRPEIRILKRLNERSAEVATFYATLIECHNVVGAPGLVVLPVYAALGGRDRLVSYFSATVGVPDTQQRHLEASHSSIVRPAQSDAELIGWLHRDVIAARLDVRAQAARERHHSSQQPAAAAADARPRIITRFMSDWSGLRWEGIYNDTRRAATTTAVAVDDTRDAPGAEIDLLIAVHHANLVLEGDPAVRSIVLQARAECDRQVSMSVGICPVGAGFATAETIVSEWLGECPPMASFYVKGAADGAGLREVLAELLQLVIYRDPRREVQAALGDEWPDESKDAYDDPGKGGY
jgi:pimeloyl-ACP methyl ester carboxylesterase